MGDYFERESLSFIPLPAETLGGWRENAVKQLNRIGSALEAGLAKMRWKLKYI